MHTHFHKIGSLDIVVMLIKLIEMCLSAAQIKRGTQRNQAVLKCLTASVQALYPI